jgi:hypothetical protein
MTQLTSFRTYVVFAYAQYIKRNAQIRTYDAALGAPLQSSRALSQQSLDIRKQNAL